MILTGRGLFQKCTPSVSRHWLLLTAGMLWSTVGTVLCIMSGYWLSELEWPLTGAVAATGIGIGGVVYRLGFSRIAAKNIQRLLDKPEKLCLFAFQAWRSYALIGVMVILGYTLRHSHIPRLVLALLYLAIGTALTLSSSLYYERVIRGLHS